MSDKFLEELTITTGLNPTDILYLVRLPSADDYQISWSDVMTQVEADLVFPHDLDYHSDVNAPTPSNAHVLKYQTGINEWVPAFVEWTEVTGKPLTFPPDPHSIGFHDDVDTTSSVPEADDGLVFDGANWVPGPMLTEGMSHLDELGQGTHRQEITHDVSVIGGQIRYTVDNEDAPGSGVDFLMHDGVLYELGVPEYVELPAGTDAVPILYYLYVEVQAGSLVLLYTTNLLDLASTNSTLLAEVEVQSVVTVDTDGPLNFRSMSHHIKGHLPHLNNAIRINLPPRVFNGIDYSNTLTLATQLDISTTSGIVWGLHYQLYDPINTATGDEITLGNDQFAFRLVPNITLATIPDDANGDSLSNRWFNLVVGITYDTNGNPRLVANLPDGSYGSNRRENCEDDVDRTAVFASPFIQDEALVLLYQLSMKFSGAGVITLGQVVDLRDNTGLVGGGGGGGDNTVIVGELDLDPRFAANEIQFNNGSVTNAGSGIAQVDIAAHLLGDISDVNAPTPLLRDGIFWDGAEWAIDRRMNWVSPYSPGTTYEQDDVVVDGAWTMIANTQTDDPAAPQTTGDPYYFYTGTLSPFENTASSIIFGNRYTSQQGGYLTGYRIETVIGNQYRVFIVVDPLGTPVVNELISFTGSVDGWTEFAVEPLILSSGTTIDLMAVVNEPDPTPTIWNANYDYGTPQNPVIPAAGTIVHPNKQSDVMAVAYLDDDATDRTTELQALNPGDLIDGPGGIQWVIQSTSDQGTYIDISVSPVSQGAPDGVFNFGFNTVTATPITIGRELDHWFSVANVSGLFIIDDRYSNIVPDNHAYGTDIQIQNATVSPDWDAVAYSAGGGGGGGGGGGLEPHALGYHTDVTITSPADDDVLQYNSGAGQWENVPIGSGAPHSIGDHTDSEYPVAPVTNDALVWQVAGYWAPQQITTDLISDWNGPYVPAAGGTFSGGVVFWGVTAPVVTVDSGVGLLINSQTTNAGLELKTDLLAEGYAQLQATTGGIIRLRHFLGGSLQNRIQFLLNGQTTMNYGNWYIPSGASLFQVAASDGVVSMGPNISDANTGIGWHSADRLQLIAGGVVTEDISATVHQMNVPLRHTAVDGDVETLSSATSIAIDTDAHNFWNVSATGNITISNPSTDRVGYVGVIKITATGADRTITFGSKYYDPSQGPAFNFTILNGESALVTFTSVDAGVYMCNRTTGYTLP